MSDARLWHPWLRINRVLRVTASSNNFANTAFIGSGDASTIQPTTGGWMTCSCGLWSNERWSQRAK
jgi:hypothetical protein